MSKLKQARLARDAALEASMQAREAYILATKKVQIELDLLALRKLRKTIQTKGDKQ